jgi:hypothetical protein
MAKKLNCTVAIQQWGDIPQYTGLKHKFRKLFSPVKMLKKIIEIIYGSLVFRNVDYDFYLSITKNPGKNTLLCHCYDYYVELLKSSTHTQEGKTSETIVFIDQMIPFHTDFLKFGNGFKVNSSTYYKKLNKLFSILEKKYNCEVVIAAHPRSISIKNYDDFFDNRKVILNRSSELISTSKFTITHYSTAINHSILNNKVILFLSSFELIKLGQYEQIKLMAHETRSSMLNLDEVTELSLHEELPLDYYDEYKLKYITQRGDKLTNGNIILKEFLLDD